MTYPDQQAQYPGYPQQPAAQPPYPPAQPQPAYPPQQYQGYPPQAPGYPQQQAPYPQQAYAQPPQAPPSAPMPVTKMTDYLEQPTMSGLSLQFNALGDRHSGTVARDLDDGDFPAQTEMDGKTPKRFRDGRVMTRMVVPLRVRPDQRHTDGKASLSVQGQMAAALKQAMADAGAGHLHGIPENGSEITVAWVSSIPPRNPGFNPTKVYEVIYRRPAGAAPAPQGNGQAQEQPPWMPPAQQAQAPAGYAGGPAVNPYPQERYDTVSHPPVPQPQYQQPGPPLPQVPTGMAGPAQQVAAATQAAVQAGQQYQVPQAPAQPAMAPPPGAHPYTAALMKQATGQPLTAEDQAALAAGPPQQ